MATPAHYNEAKLWLASAIERTADWRTDKAQEYSDDPRNLRAAVSLRQAAYYLRGTQASPGVQRIAELIADCLASGIDLTAGETSLPGSESERIAARYFFDRFAGVADDRSHEELIEDLYHAMLRDLRDSDPTPTSPLALRLGREDAMFVDDRPLHEHLVGQLTEISRLLAQLAETAAAEAAPDGRLPSLFQSTRVPLIRKQLEVAITALVVLGGPALEQATKLVTEPPLFEAGYISGVLGALDEVNAALKGVGARETQPAFS